MARTSAAKTVLAKLAAKPASKAAAKPVTKPAAKRSTTAAKAAEANPATKPATKAARKPAGKAVPAAPRTQPAAPAPVRTAKQAATQLAKRAREDARMEAASAPRPALVRDSFTMPEGEYAVLGVVKQACLQAGVEVKKSELLRIGVALLGQLDIAALRAVLGSLPQLKTGRPPGE
jgi:hypothetical protein